MNETLTPGQRASVAVGLSTVWTSPDAPRACDAPAIASAPRPQDWVSGMTRAQREDLHGRTLTQVLFGDAVHVDEVAGDWARVVATEQAAPCLDPRGYPGWLPAAHIVADGASGEQAAGERHILDALASTLHQGPEASSPVLDVVLGTRLTVVGPARGRYVPVAAPGRAAPLWAALADLVPVTAEPPAAKDVLQAALRFEGVPYIWGGVSPYGIDCSGLVYLSHRRAGAVIPRDAADQADASSPVEPAEQSPGNLCFFRNPGAPIDHVALIHAPGHLLHASGRAGRVLQEPLEGTLARRLTAVHRTLP